MTTWAAVLTETGETSTLGTVEVPRVLTEDLWRAAERAKLNGSNMTIADWLETAERSDLEHLGIPWPEMAYDRHQTIAENVRELIIRTLWNAIIARVDATAGR